MNKQISNVITQLRVISTIVIVVYHAACPYGGLEAFTATISNNISSMNIINLIFQKLLCNDMLPMFFSLSGMLFYGKKDTYKDTLLVFWKKFDRLIVPAALIFLFCSWFDIPFVGHAGPEGHLWFVYVLFIYFCWALIMNRINIHVLMSFATAGYIVYTFSSRLELDIHPFITQLLRYQIYFTGGYYLVNYYDLLRKNYIRWPLMFIHLISLLLDFQTGYYLLFNLVVIAFIPQREIKPIIKSLNNNSFGIYLIHHVLTISLFQINWIYHSYVNYPLLAIISMSIGVLAASWFLSAILHRIKFNYF